MKKEEPDRAARLGEALRANLRRRKAQARDQEAVAAALEPPAEAEPPRR